jgi:hypothetical protein
MIAKKYPLITCSTQPGSDIVFAEFPANLKVDLEEAQEIVRNRLQFTQNKPHYLISDTTNVRQVTAEAKEFLQRPAGGLKNILGAAFIGSNPVAVLIANIFIKTPKNFQARFFPSREAAFAWIEEHKIKMSIK